MNTDEMIQRRIPRVLQYGSFQMILFVMGIMLALGVVGETGVLQQASAYVDREVGNVWIVGLMCGVTSSVLDGFATMMTAISMHSVVEGEGLYSSAGSYLAYFVQNGSYWKVVAFMSMAGGNILPIGSISGLALLRTERMRVGWYFRNVGWRALIGGIVGMALLWSIV